MVLALGFMAVAMVVGVGAVGWSLDGNSDYYAWQRLLHIWVDQGHQTAWISEDLFPTRFPLYLVFDAVGLDGQRGMVAASMVLNLAAGAAFAGALLLGEVVRRPVRVATVAVLALTATWTALTWDDVFFFNPNSRTLELGLALLGVAWLGRATASGRMRAPRVALVVAALGLLWLSDPFVLYFVALPAAAVAAGDLLAPVRRSGGRLVLVLLAGSAVLGWVLRRALELIDLTAVPVGDDRRFITSAGDVPDRVRAVADEIVRLLGVNGSDLTSSSFDDLALAWLRLALVGLGMVGAVIVVRSWSRSSLLARTLVVALVADLGAVTMTNLVDDPKFVIGRYLSVALIALLGLAALAVDQLRGRIGTTAAVIVAVFVAGVVVTNANTWWDTRDATPGVEARALDAAVESHGWDRVYGSYWMAIRHAELGAGNVRWVTVECKRTEGLRLMHWNNDTAVLRGHPDSIAVAIGSGEPTRLPCSVADLTDAFGAPDEVATVRGVRFAVWEQPPERLRSIR